jgi:hypothetical protein
MLVRDWNVLCSPILSPCLDKIVSGHETVLKIRLSLQGESSPGTYVVLGRVCPRMRFFLGCI